MLKLTGSRKSTTRKITFALPSDHPAGKVSVVGNFNDWTPGADLLKKRSNGTMSATVTVPSDYIVAFEPVRSGSSSFRYGAPAER